MDDLEKFAYKTGVKSNKNKMRRHKYEGMPSIDECSLCRRIVQLGARKLKLCPRCYIWCKDWIIKVYGQYNRLKIPEAMDAYYKPLICNACGEPMSPVIAPGRRRKSKLCDKCKVIHDKAYQDAFKRERRSGRYRVK